MVVLLPGGSSGLVSASRAIRRSVWSSSCQVALPGLVSASRSVGAAAPVLRHSPAHFLRVLAQVLEESKALVRCNMRLELEQANERECGC